MTADDDGPRLADEGAARRRRSGAIEFAGVCRRYHAPIVGTDEGGPPPVGLAERFVCLVAALAAGTRRLDGRRLHRLGYSIGTAYAPTWLEPLTLAEPDRHGLAANMSFTMEPHLMHLEEGWGFPLGDAVRCTPEGGESLTPFPHSLWLVGERGAPRRRAAAPGVRGPSVSCLAEAAPAAVVPRPAAR